MVIKNMTPEIISSPAALNFSRHFREICNSTLSSFFHSQTLHEDLRTIFTPPLLDNNCHFILVGAALTRSMESPEKLDVNGGQILASAVCLSFFDEMEVVVGNQVAVLEDLGEGSHCSLESLSFGERVRGIFWGIGNGQGREMGDGGL
jgi:hypothetical protein